MTSGDVKPALSVVTLIAQKNGSRVHLKINLGHVHNVETQFNHILFIRKKSSYVCYCFFQLLINVFLIFWVWDCLIASELFCYLIRYHQLCDLLEARLDTILESYSLLAFADTLFDICYLIF